MFAGSYNKEDCIFLLKPIDIKETSIKEKEKLIKKGVHYSNFLNPEYEPTKEYLKLFYDLLELNKYSFVKNLIILSKIINKNYNKDITLVSLARAGTPIGILLKKILEVYFNRKVVHYSISIIRDKEIDKNALKYITNKHDSNTICWIDGWTGKGVIKDELDKFIEEYNIENNTNINSNLYVLNDIAYKADYAASYEDELIPSSMLNSIISGLISRTILNDEYILQNDYHGCKYFKEFENIDLSNWFIDYIFNEVLIEFLSKNNINNLKIPNIENKLEKQKQKTNEIINLMKEYNIKNINLIKPGIGETTRVLLRRIPDKLIVKNLNDKYIQHLILLAKEKNIPIIEKKELTYKTLGIIIS